MPVTTPLAETVAVVLLLLHVPPDTLSDNMMDEPVHTLEGPVIVPGFDVVLTVMVIVAVAVPHVPVTTYIIISEPDVTPVTIPDAEPIVATAELLLLQMPPVIASDNVIVEPTHTSERPVIVPAFVGVFTVTVLVVIQPAGRV